MQQNNGIELTPNYDVLFAQFEREVRIKIATILADFGPPCTDSVEAWQHTQVQVLRTIQGLLAPINICAHSMVNTEHVERLRNLLLEAVQTVEKRANDLERYLEDGEGNDDVF